jgi:glycerophosphoryl diester phosphodiesterase
MRFILSLLGIVPVFWVILHLSQMLVTRFEDRRSFVVGHRGAAGLAPENTIPAIEVGIRHGVHAIEVDVHRTRDGRLVVMHDTSVERTTNGTGEIRELRWDEMRRLDAGGHFSPSYAGVSAPTLSEVIDRVLGAGCELVVEVKDPAHYPGIARDLADLLAKKTSGIADDVIVISFDLQWLRHFHEIAPEVSLGQLHLWGGRWPKVPGTVVVDVYWRSVILDPTLVWRSSRRGYRCWAWTVNRPWAAQLLWMLGVEAVTTDRPDLVRVADPGTGD